MHELAPMLASTLTGEDAWVGVLGLVENRGGTVTRDQQPTFVILVCDDFPSNP